MPLPLLATKPITQNARVHNFAIGSDEAPRSQVSVDEQIERAYRQIFFHAFKVDREPMLEMQLRNGDITTRDFVGACCSRASSAKGSIAATATTASSSNSLVGFSAVRCMAIRSASPGPS